MKNFILALDQGTTSSRAIIFNTKGQSIASAQQEFPQIYPRPGWVEHDPEAIWQSQLNVMRQSLKKAGLSAADIKGIGITNQRETTVLWERKSGKPVYNAIVWQCRRSSDICDELKKKGLEKSIRAKTGLLLDSYFSASKLTWLFREQPEIYKRALNGEICFGTIDSWLLFKLTGQHQTDPSNAGRTMLFNIHDGNWDKELLDIFGVPEAILPEVKKSCGLFANTLPEVIGASVPVCGIAGDQQASLFGQACFSEGDIKNTYGTGCFSLVNTGTQAVKSEHRLLTTVAWDIGNGLEYALEGSVFIAGAVIQWLRDQLGIIEHASESEKLARQVDDNGGVYLVPAFVGMGAPYWDSAVRGTLFGLTRCSSKSHIARAALESIAFQTSDLLRALQEDLKQDFKFLKADGGATANSFLMQFQTDLLEIPLIIPGNAETTALGAAYLAGLHCGIWNSLDEIRQNWHEAQRFTPSMANETRNHLLNSWQQAVKSARAFQG